MYEVFPDDLICFCQHLDVSAVQIYSQNDTIKWIKNEIYLMLQWNVFQQQLKKLLKYLRFARQLRIRPIWKCFYIRIRFFFLLFSMNGRQMNDMKRLLQETFQSGCKICNLVKIHWCSQVKTQRHLINKDSQLNRLIFHLTKM